ARRAAPAHRSRGALRRDAPPGRVPDQPHLRSALRRLPRRPARPRPGQAAQARPGARAGGPGAPAVTRPRSILVVEDETSLRELIAHILLLDEHEVDSARDGVEALYRI